jgi:phosphopantothenoylcysteine decarboxylase/phosphopantothenate--cysteine ligase
LRLPEYHPVKDIVGEVNRYLEGKTVILGITGSVAAYKAVDTARWLIRRGARVIPVMTYEARKYVGEILLHWATGFKPLIELTGETEHVGLVRSSDSILVAPATLSTVAKIAYGIVDNPVALAAVSALGYGKSVIVAPAMHSSLYDSEQYKFAVKRLEEQGVTIIPPVVEKGVARYPQPELVARIAASVTSRGRDMRGLRVLVTAGPTREWLDRVRFISNPSSGRMGVEVAVESWSRGASVDLVHGPMSLQPPHMVRRFNVETTSDMRDIVSKLTEEEYDVIVAAAAPVDFTPGERYEGKVKSGVELILNLKPTPKVLEGIRRKPRVLVAFAAEHTLDVDKLREAALEKLNRYKADIVVANPVGFPGTGFASETNMALIAYGDGSYRVLGAMHKELLARLVVDEALKILRRG